MSEGFEPAYVYARACGSLARSFLGERAAALAASHRVGEAWRSIFGEAPPALPEAQLATAAERRLRARSFDALRGIAGPLMKSEPFVAALARKWEFGYLKNVLAAVVERSAEAPSLENPRLEPTFNVGGYPDLGSMLKGTSYSWIIESGLEQLQPAKNRLDRQYYAELWDSARGLTPGLRGSIPDLIRLEAELENLVLGPETEALLLHGRRGGGGTPDRARWRGRPVARAPGGRPQGGLPLGMGRLEMGIPDPRLAARGRRGLVLRRPWLRVRDPPPLLS